MPEADIKTAVRGFLEKFVRGDDVGDDDNIFELGYVNSLFAMQLVLFIEKAFGLAVKNEDLDVKNFSSVTAIADYVARHAPPKA